MDIVEIQPSKDNAAMLTCVTAGRLIVNLIGASIRAGYFDRKVRSDPMAHTRIRKFNTRATYPEQKAG